MSRKLVRAVNCANVMHRNWSQCENVSVGYRPAWRATHCLNTSRGRCALTCAKTSWPLSMAHPANEWRVCLRGGRFDIDLDRTGPNLQTDQLLTAQMRMDLRTAVGLTRNPVAFHGRCERHWMPDRVRHDSRGRGLSLRARPAIQWLSTAV